MITPGVDTGLLTVHVFPRGMENLTLLCQERGLEISSPHVPVAVIRCGNLIHRKVPIIPRERNEDRCGFVILPIIQAPWVGDVSYPSTRELKIEVFSFLRKVAFPRHVAAADLPEWLLEGANWEDLDVEPLARWPQAEEEEEPVNKGEYLQINGGQHMA